MTAKIIIGLIATVPLMIFCITTIRNGGYFAPHLLGLLLCLSRPTRGYGYGLLLGLFLSFPFFMASGAP